MNVIVDENNVIECYKIFEDYVDEHKEEFETEYIDYDFFVDWCYEELYKCPNCGNIVFKDDQTRMCDPFNCDNVCDECIEVNGYYE